MCWRERDVETALSAATSWSVAEAAGFYPDMYVGVAVRKRPPESHPA